MKIPVLTLACLTAFHLDVALATVPDSESLEIRYVSKAHALTTQLDLPVGGNRSYVVGNYNFEMKTLGDTPVTTSFVAYCVDPFQWTEKTFRVYDAMPLSDFLGGPRYDQVSKLFGHAYAGTLTDATKAAGFQLALWEIFNDDGNLATGSVRVTNLTNASVKNEAQSLLNALPTWMDNGTPYTLTFYRSNSFQDYLAVTGTLMPVPEPESYALLLAGLGLAGWAVRRRGSKGMLQN